MTVFTTNRGHPTSCKRKSLPTFLNLRLDTCTASQADQILAEADCITLANCICRQKYQNCDKPLIYQQDLYYGCGLCITICPADAIQMKPRNGSDI